MVEIKRAELLDFMKGAQARLEEENDGGLQIRFTNANSPLKHDFVIPLLDFDEQGNSKLVANMLIRYPVGVPVYLQRMLADCSVERIKDSELYAIGLQFQQNPRATHLEKIFPTFLRNNFPELDVHRRDSITVMVGTAEALNGFSQVMDFPEVQNHLETMITARMESLGQRTGGSKVVSLFTVPEPPQQGQ